MTLCVAAVAFGAKAQKSDASGMEYGVKAGVNFSSDKTSGGGVSTTESGTGFLAGVYAAFPVSNAIKIQPELLYDNQSTTNSGVTDNANYLSVPVLAKYAFKSSGFSVLAGPQIGLLLSAKEKADGTSTDIKSSLNSTNFSLAVGAEYDLPMGLNFAARYNIGLSNIAKSTSDGITDKLSCFALTVGYKFSK